MLPLQLTCFTASQNRCMSEEFQGERGRERTLMVSRDCWGIASIRITSFVKSCTVMSTFMDQSLAETRAHLYVLQCENLNRHPVPYSPCKSPCQNLPRSFRECSIHYAARVALISSPCWEGYSIATCMRSPLRSTVVALQISISRFGPAYHKHAIRTETGPGETQLGMRQRSVLPVRKPSNAFSPDQQSCLA